MKKIKKGILAILCAFTAACAVGGFAACETEGDFTSGEVPVEISVDGYWVIDGLKTKYKAEEHDGSAPVISINESGYWVVDGVSTGKKALDDSGAIEFYVKNGHLYIRMSDDGEALDLGAVSEGAPSIVQKYTVSFDADNGQTIPSQEIAEGQKVQNPGDPEKEDYTFLGWYYQEEKWSFVEDVVTCDMTLTAKWERDLQTYTVTLDKNIAEAGMVEGNGNYVEGTEVTLRAQTNEGYTFLGWHDGSTFVSTDTTYKFTPTSSVEIEARWEKKTYTVTLLADPANVGTVSGGGTCEHGDNVTITAETTDSDYVFVGWFDEAGEEWSKEATCTLENVTAGITLTAKWEKSLDTYVVTLTQNLAEGGTVTGGGNYTEGTEVTLQAQTNEGYTFLGWHDGSTFVSTDATYKFTPTSSVEIEARWEKKTYTVTLIASPEEAGTVSGGGTWQHGESGTLIATTTDSNYIFKGWYDAQDNLKSSEPSYTLDDVTANVTLTAKWELRQVELTLASDFDIAGTLTGEGTYSYNESVQLVATANTNYTFLGWYDGDTLLSNSPTFSYQVKDDKTITAHWQDDWKEIEGYAYWTMPQHGNDVMPIVGFTDPSASTDDMGRTEGFESQITEKNWKILADSGVNTVVSWWNDWTNANLHDDILLAMDFAEKYGVSYIVNNREAMSLTTSGQVDAHAEYVSKPAYGGTILIDEPGAVNFADIASATRAWETSNYSDTLAYVNMLPNYAAQWQLEDCQGTGGTYEGAFSNYEEWVKLYLDTVKPQVFSYDHYPYLFTKPNYFRDGWYTNLSNVRYYTAKAGVPYWVYGQLGGWPEYGQTIDSSTLHLTYGHTALQFNSMLSYGAKGIQYYNYFMPPNYASAGNYTSATMADGTPTPYYEHIQKINKQVAAIDHVLLRCAWKGIIQLNSSPSTIPGGDKVATYGALSNTPVTGSGNAIVGCFEYRDLGYAYYVTTNDVYNASTVTLNFNNSYNLTKIQEGVESKTSGSSITLNIPAGEGVLVVVPHN